MLRYALAMWLFMLSVAWADEPLLVVVGHLGVSPQALSTAQLQAIFSMRTRTWPNGAPVRVLVLPDNNKLHHAFVAKWLNLLPFQLRRAWDRLVFSGIGRAPETVQTEQEMLTRVAATPGSIGYLSQGLVDASIYVVQTP